MIFTSQHPVPLELPYLREEEIEIDHRKIREMVP